MLHPTEPDAATVVEAGSVEAGVDAGPKCNASDSFGAPTLISELNSTGLDAAPRVTSDELAVVFFTNRVMGGSIWDFFGGAHVDVDAVQHACDRRRREQLDDARSRSVPQ